MSFLVLKPLCSARAVESGLLVCVALGAAVHVDGRVAVRRRVVVCIVMLHLQRPKLLAAALAAQDFDPHAHSHARKLCMLPSSRIEFQRT
jgi:hypothetical protein